MNNSPFKCLNPSNAAPSLKAFFTSHHTPRSEQMDYLCWFELEQLWIRDIYTNETWMVCDSVRGEGVDGFRFIKIYEGDVLQ